MQHIITKYFGPCPGALKSQGIAMRSMVPGYLAELAELEGGAVLHRYADLFGGEVRLVGGMAKGLDIIAVDAPHLFDHPGNIYLGPDGKDWPDNAQRYGALSMAVAVAGVGHGIIAGYVPDLLHLHDWQAALAAVHVKFGGGPKTLLTVHNIAFQGQFPASVFASLKLPPQAFASLKLPPQAFAPGFRHRWPRILRHRQLPQGWPGLACADAISTVSPSYAQEICTPEYGNPGPCVGVWRQ